MTLLVILLSLFFIAIGLSCSKRNVLAPSVLTGAVWLVCMILQSIYSTDFPKLSFNFYACISIWIIGICFGSMICQAATYHNTQLNDPEIVIRNIYLFLSLLEIPQLYDFATTAITNGQSGHWALDLRYAALGMGSGFDKPLGGFIFLIVQSSFLLELLCFNQKQKWRLLLSSFCFLLFGFISMSKIIFLNFFLYSCTILYFKGHLKAKHIGVGVVLLTSLLLVLQAIRHSTEIDAVKKNFVPTYILGNFYAFDSLTPCSSAHWGENVFRIFYSIFYKLGLSEIEPVNTIIKWVDKPIHTNTYTGMYPFYVDYGIFGIMIFSVIIGFVYGYFFKKSQEGSNFHMLIYAFLTGIIVMQYAADEFFSTLTTNIKIGIILSIPFLFKKYKLLSTNDFISRHIKIGGLK